jgi:hypothetical protein
MTSNSLTLLKIKNCRSRSVGRDLCLFFCIPLRTVDAYVWWTCDNLVAMIVVVRLAGRRVCLCCWLVSLRFFCRRSWTCDFCFPKSIKNCRSRSVGRDLCLFFCIPLRTVDAYVWWTCDNLVAMIVVVRLAGRRVCLYCCSDIFAVINSYSPEKL